ncbi:alpha/beta hydrolase [Kineococcus siccus]|uniref:alpha/beta fold hydrolase n=1 Tax=Kineococcus siccus TaxID=2696567 RepID=UPI0030B7FA72
MSSDFFADFQLEHVQVGEVRLRVRHGGSGPAVLLLHGHPRTHTTWWQVAPLLAADFTVVCPDLRGYGASTTTPTRDDHAQASKRVMADDVLALMRALGHERFAVVGHDRGAYVAHRLAMDHPQAVSHLTILDSVAIGDALERADAGFAQLWWHWFFLGQTVKPAEPLINANPLAWYRPDAPAMGQDNQDDLVAAISNPAVVHAMCEDYRAGLGVDRVADDADRAAGRRLQCPLLVLWASGDDMGTLYGDPLQVWRPWVEPGSGRLSGHVIDSGHHLSEDAPDVLAAALRNALTAG